jgi:hypothetical protein
VVLSFASALFQALVAVALVGAFIDRFPHLEHHRWRDRIFYDRRCEYADIRHALRRIVAHRDREAEERLRLPVWQDDDPLASLFATMLGAYPAPTDQIPDYKAGVHEVFGTVEMSIAANDPLPPQLLGGMSPLALTRYISEIARLTTVLH